MPRYMIQASYTSEAAAAFASKPQDRVAGLRALLEQIGAQLDSFDYCLGDYDVMVTYTAPDRRSHNPGSPRAGPPKGIQDDETAFTRGVHRSLAEGCGGGVSGAITRIGGGHKAGA